jgi:transcriptional regulator with XRE-family HTH domain
MNFSKLETLRKLKKLTYEELAEMIGMSKNGLNVAINNKDLKISTLEKLANVLGVKPGVFFEDSPIHDTMEPLEEYKTGKIQVQSCANCSKLERIIEKLDGIIGIINRLEQDLEACRSQLNQRPTSL